MKLFRILVAIFLSIAGSTSISSMEKPEINTPQNQQLLLTAIRAGNVIEVNTLLEAGLDPNFNAGSLQNPLIAAIISNNPDIVQLLLQHNADPNTIADAQTRNSALMFALQVMHAHRPGVPEFGPQSTQFKQDQIIFKLLASPKLDINQKNANGYTPLMIAISDKPTFIGTILNAKNLDINAQSNSGNTALMLLIQKLTVYGALPLIKKMLENKDLNINLADNNGQTALDYARKKKSKQLENLLIEHGATAGSPERRKMPQGAYSAFGQAQPQAAAYQASPAFAQAAQFSARPASAQFSYSAQPAGGARPTGTFSAQPASSQAYYAAQPTTQPAVQAAAIRTPDQQLALAVFQGNLSAVETLFKSGVNPNAINPFGTPIVYTALINPHMLNLFLAQSSFNPNIKNNFGTPLLMNAITSNNIVAAQTLINDPRTDVNLQDSLGYTPLDQAVIQKNQTLINLLRAKGARINKAMPPQQPKAPAEPVVTEAFAPEVYAALGLQPNTRSAYTILGVIPTTLPDVIKTRARQLQLQWHPDKNPDKPELAKQVFQLINRAYQEIQKAKGL